jgi:hypothetical protein
MSASSARSEPVGHVSRPSLDDGGDAYCTFGAPHAGAAGGAVGVFISGRGK